MVMVGRLRSWAKRSPLSRRRVALQALKQTPRAAMHGKVTLQSGEVGVGDAGGFEQRVKAASAGLLGFEGGPGGVVDEAERAAVRGEAGVGVVDAEVQAELGARGEHAVGLVGALGDEVVDEDAGVGFGAVEGEGRG